MNTNIGEKKSIVISEFISILRDPENRNKYRLFKAFKDSLFWYDILDIVKSRLTGEFKDKYSDEDTLVLIKSLVLKKLLDLTDFILPFKIAENDYLKEFIGVTGYNEIPTIRKINSFSEYLEKNKISNLLFNAFYENIENANINISGSSDSGNGYIEDESFKSENKESINRDLLNIEMRINNIFDEKLREILTETGISLADDINEKLTEIRNQIEIITRSEKLWESRAYERILNISRNINNINNLVLMLENNEFEIDKNEKKFKTKEKSLYAKILDSFVKALNNKPSKPVEDINGEELNNEGKSNLDYIDEIIIELDKSIDELKEISGIEDKLFQRETDEKILRPVLRRIIPAKEYGTEIGDSEPITINPKTKIEGIFNDENLTEDYELGFRFHQLKLKTGFFNVMLDSNNDASRIATAEFFPNKFWASVKQRSRWIAGICLQNWKAHKWKGNIVTKYFLYRDRKPLFTLFSAFLAQFVFIYFIYLFINYIFGINDDYVSINYSSPVLYLMAVNLFFMLSRTVQRFSFTYNWYGFRYASTSVARMILDTFINFFAVIRAFNIFRKTKKKVVWDSTLHY
jgi:hypothetical protein